MIAWLLANYPEQLNPARDDAQALVSTIAERDLAGRPVYVVWTEALGIHEPMGGCWTPDLDLLARETIGPGWIGRGPALGISAGTAWLRAFADACAGSVSVEDFRSGAAFTSRVLPVVIHELSHELEQAADRSALPGTAAADAAADRERRDLHRLNHLWTECRRQDSSLGTVATVSDLASHGRMFLRVAAHLVARCDLIGSPIDPADVVPADFYHLSPFADYIDSLGDEPYRMQSRTLAEILASPAPAAFTSLWRADVTRRFTQCQTQTRLLAASI